jgi:hypothetical protein
MYKQFNKFEVDYLAKEQIVVASNTNTDGNGGAFDLSGTQGSIEIIAQAFTDIVIPDTKIFTVKLQSSATDSGYTDLVTLYTKTAAAVSPAVTETILAGTILGRYIVPNDAKPYIKANLVSNDTGFTGKVNVFQSEVSR